MPFSSGRSWTFGPARHPMTALPISLENDYEKTSELPWHAGVDVRGQVVQQLAGLSTQHLVVSIGQARSFRMHVRGEGNPRRIDRSLPGRAC